MSIQPAEGRQLPLKQEAVNGRQRIPFYWRFFGTVLLMVAMFFVLGASTASSSTLAVPTISITGVVQDQTVSIQTYNYPPNQTFEVRMNYMGTLGYGGEFVGYLNSGSGGSVTGDFAIPGFLRGQQQIAVRLDSPQGYYSFNWFWNNSTGSNAGNRNPGDTGTGDRVGASPGYVGIPTFRIISVEGNQVTIETNNFPANQLFDVTMGPMYTQGINGTKVGEISSGNGGIFQQTFTIPDEYLVFSRVSMRAQTRHVNPYYAYNWFWNNPQPTPGNGGNSGGDGSGGNTGTGGLPDYSTVWGTPTITICSVVRDQNITFQTRNYPGNMPFTITMGAMGTQGIGGAVSTTIDSGSGGVNRYTVPIPAGVHGYNQIAVRAQGTNGFFSYNWFWNSSTSVDFCG